LQPSDGPATGTTEGRRAPRLQVAGQIRGHLVAHDKPVQLTEIGLDGFRMETTVELAVGDVHEFRFTLRDGSVIFARAKVAHTYLRPTSGGTFVLVAGLAFLDETWRGRSTSDLVDDITSSISFE
jgi:hypothetical protein